MTISKDVKKIVEGFNSTQWLEDKTQTVGEALLLAALSAEKSESLSTNIQAQVNDSAANDGSSDVQARVEGDNFSFTTLKNRLDAKEADNSIKFSQDAEIQQELAAQVGEDSGFVCNFDLTPFLDNNENDLILAMLELFEGITTQTFYNNVKINLPLDRELFLSGTLNFPDNYDVTLNVPFGTKIIATAPAAAIRTRGKASIVGSGTIDFDFLNTSTGIQSANGSELYIGGITIQKSLSNSINLLGRSRISGIVVHSMNSNNIDGRENSNDQLGIQVSTNERVVIRDSVLYDIVGNGIYLNGQYVGNQLNVSVENNTIYNISNITGSGQYGNGIHGWVANGVSIKNNWVGDCSYSAIRVAACKNVEVLSNQLNNTVSVDDGSGVFAEFTHENVIINDNHLKDCSIMIKNQENANGKNTICHGNLIIGGRIETEADTVVTNNIIDIGNHNYRIGILLGYGRTCHDIVCSGNIIKDSKADPTLTAGIACLYVWNAGSSGRWHNVKVFGNSVFNAQVSVAGHRDGNVVNSDGHIEPKPKYVEAFGNNDGHNGDEFTGFSRYGQTPVSMVAGRLLKNTNRSYFNSTAADRRLLKITIDDSDWQSGSYSQHQYVVSMYNTSKAIQYRSSFRTSKHHNLAVYENSEYYYFVVQVSGFWNVSVESHYLGGLSPDLDGGYEKFVVRGPSSYGIDLDSMTNVTSSFPVINAEV